MTLRSLTSRYRPLAWLLVVFLVISTATRVVLLGAAGSGVPVNPLYWLDVFAIGFGFDLLTFVYFAWPLVLLLWVLPQRWSTLRRGRWPVATMCFALLCVIGFVAVAEWTFWDEFQNRFNFIAVDYLVYTTEVLGNIRESYPVGKILAGLAVFATAVFALTARKRRMDGDASTFGQRSVFVGLWLLVTVAGTWTIDAEMKDSGKNAYADE